MTKTTKAGRRLAVALAALFVAPVVPTLAGVGSTAHADGIRVRIGGSVRVRVGSPVRVRTRRWRRRHRRVYRPRRVYSYGGFYSYRFASPPPPRQVYCDAPPPAYGCESGPVVARTVVRHAPLPRLGLGITTGRFETDSGRDADDFGVFGRLRLTNALELEVETVKTTHDDGTRLDKRLGAALYVDFSTYSTWSPYAVGGAGVVSAEVNGSEYERHYGEIGGGLRWRLSQRFTVAGDLRVGKSAAADSDSDKIALAIVPQINDEEQYTRFALKGILYF